MTDRIATMEVFPLQIPRDTPYLGPLEAGVQPSERGYFIRPGNQTVYSMIHEYQHSIFDRNLRFVTGNMRCEAGYFALPDGPGLGVEPRAELFEYVLS